MPEAGAERKPRRLLAQLIAETRHDLELSMSICDLLLGRRQRAQKLCAEHHVGDVGDDGGLHHRAIGGVVADALALLVEIVLAG